MAGSLGKKKAAAAPVLSRTYLKRRCKSDIVPELSSALDSGTGASIDDEDEDAKLPSTAAKHRPADKPSSKPVRTIRVPVLLDTYIYRSLNPIIWNSSSVSPRGPTATSQYFAREYGFVVDPSINPSTFIGSGRSASSWQNVQTTVVDRPTDCTGPQDTFNFLGLPAELRNMVYSYVVGKHRTGGKPIFSHTERYAYPPTMASANGRNTTVRRKLYSILYATKALRDEALDVLYAQSTFHIKLTQDTMTLFWNLSWNSDSLTNLTIELASTMGVYGQNLVATWSYGPQGPFAQAKPRWDGLRTLTKLRSLRLFISMEFQSSKYRRIFGRSTVRSAGFGTLVTPPKPYGAVDTLLTIFPQGTPEFRQMMRDFVASIPPSVKDVQFGLAEADRTTQELFFSKKRLSEGYTVFLPAEYMQQRYEELKSLPSSDVEL